MDGLLIRLRMATSVYSKEVRAQRKSVLNEFRLLWFYVCVTKQNEKDEAITERMRERERTMVITGVAETTCKQLICLLCHLRYVCLLSYDSGRNSLKTKQSPHLTRQSNGVVAIRLFQGNCDNKYNAVLLLDYVVSCWSMLFKDE